MKVTSTPDKKDDLSVKNTFDQGMKLKDRMHQIETKFKFVSPKIKLAASGKFFRYYSTIFGNATVMGTLVAYHQSHLYFPTFNIIKKSVGSW